MSALDLLPGVEQDSRVKIALRDRKNLNHLKEDVSLFRLGVLDRLSLVGGYQKKNNPVDFVITKLVKKDEEVHPSLLVNNPDYFTNPVQKNGVWVDGAFDNARRKLVAVRRTKNLRVTMGRDQWQRVLMMGDVGAGTGISGAVGTATSTTATSVTDSGASFTTAAQSSGNTGLQGHIVCVGPNASGTGSQVFGVIMSNTGTAITVDQWYAVPVTGAAGTTPNGTGKYMVLPGAAWAAWVGLSTNSSAAAAGDVLRTADGLFGDGTTGGAATEQNANGLARAYLGQGGGTAPTFGSGTYVLKNTWTYTAASSVTLQKVVMCNSLAAAGSLLFLETLLNASGTVNANGDTITVTWTVTL